MSFRDLERADKLIADYNNYKVWKQKSSADRQVAYDLLNVNRFKYEKEIVYVAPFGVGGRDFFVPIRAPKASQAPPCPTLLGVLTNYFETGVPAGPGISSAQAGVYPNSKLAKLSLKYMQTLATTKSDSRITGRKYFRHTTNSASMAFGKQAANDDYFDVVKAISAKAAFISFKNIKGNSVSFIPEG